MRGAKRGDKHPNWITTPDKDWFYQKYIVEKKSIYKISKELNIHYHTVYRRLHSFSILLRKQREAIMGDRHPNWKGGKRINNGYIRVYVPDHPFADSHRTVYEHRLVVEKRLGRYLEPGEVIHHLNGIKTDNRDENLVVMLNDEHSRETGRLKKAMSQRIKKLEEELEHVKTKCCEMQRID